MNKIKIITNEEEYKEALKLAEELITLDPDSESVEGEKLALLSTLIEDYESKAFPRTLPSPIEAIQFRMEQAGLKPSDLVPFIGSRGRVSEILSGKRQLTIEMIRALESGLGIPAEVLIRKSEPVESPFNSWSKTLIKEMSERGYFKKPLTSSNGVELVETFFSQVDSNKNGIFAMLRQANYRSAPKTDQNALSSWLAKLLIQAKRLKAPVKYKKGTVDLEFMQKLAKLSVEDNAPIKAQQFLKEHGILLLIEPHLSKTRLDGAVLLDNKDAPVIGLTLRLDRLDNFWFTLMHELAHIALHYDQDIEVFYDELDEVKGVELNSKEREADALASEALIPTKKWETSPAKLIPSPLAASSLAKELGVHIAIVAGKIRFEGKKWTYLNGIVGESKVRQYFKK